MKRFKLRLLRQKVVQVPVTASVATSAALPTTSGLPWLDNSRGASVTLVEFSDALSSVANAVDLTDETPKEGSFKAEFRRLEEATGEYENSSSDCCSGIDNWDGSQALALGIVAAFNCAAAVYKEGPKSLDVHDAGTSSLGLQSQHRDPRSDRVEFRELRYGAASLLGTTKALGIWRVDSTLPCEELPALVIACRGTESMLDTIVNANGRPRSLADFLAAEPPTSLATHMKNLTVHGGFLNSATRLSALVARQLIEANKNTPPLHVIFTGHSAGGAVASLLFLRSVLEARDNYPRLILSCITFGSPPTLSADITGPLRQAPELAANRRHILAFVNESDIVPRADQAYTRSLIDLYRSKHGLGSVMASPIPCLDEGSSYILPPLSFQVEDQLKQDSMEDEGRQWKLPLPDYHILGDLVHLRKLLVETEGGDEQDRVLLAQTIPQREFQRLLYCGTRTHSRSYYNDRVNMLLRGRFNYRESW